MNNPLVDFAESIIFGVGGLEDKYMYEGAVDNLPHDQTVVIWTLKCLANPECEGSAEILRLISERRAEQE